MSSVTPSMTKTPASFGKAAQDALCACPQKLEIIARIDQEIKCGLDGDTCKAVNTTARTWGSALNGCAVSFADVKKVADSQESRLLMPASQEVSFAAALGMPVGIFLAGLLYLL